METKAGASDRRGRARRVRGERVFSRQQIEVHKRDGKCPVYLRRYDSLGEWQTHAEWWYFEQCRKSVEDWLGSSTCSWLCARWGTVSAGMDALRVGKADPEAMRNMEEWREKMALEIDAPTLGNTRRRHFVFADQGDEVDPDRFNAGHDRPWRTMRMGKTAPVIRFGLDATTVSSVSDCGFSRLGGLAAAACDVLARQGRSVEVVLMETEEVRYSRSAQDDRRGHWVHLCTLKAAHEPLDIERIASVCSPIFSRLLCNATDNFDAGQYNMALDSWQVKEAAPLIGIDCLVDSSTTPADIAEQIKIV